MDDLDLIYKLSRLNSQKHKDPFDREEIELKDENNEEEIKEQ